MLDSSLNFKQDKNSPPQTLIQTKKAYHKFLSSFPYVQVPPALFFLSYLTNDSYLLSPMLPTHFPCTSNNCNYAHILEFSRLTSWQ